MRKFLVTFILATAALSAPLNPLERARRLYSRAEYGAALKAALAVPHKDARVYALMGKAYYGTGNFNAATKALERAVALEPGNYDYWHWLGKAWGRRADHAIFFKAPGYAVKCRKAFEKAMKLAPDNLEVINDLFSYYLDAPGFLGGGVDKAEQLSRRIRELDLAEYQYALAQLAKKRKDFTAAENHLRRAMEIEPNDAGRVLDLANFLAERGRIAESDWLFERAGRLAPHSPKVMFARAAAYVRQNRKPGEAKQLLRDYLAAELTPDDPPRREARALLRKAERISG